MCNTVSSCFCLTSGKGIADSSANGDKSMVCWRASDAVISVPSFVDPVEVEDVFLVGGCFSLSFLASILCCNPCLVKKVRASHPH